MSVEVVEDSILREARPEYSRIPPLDPTLFELSNEEKTFLKTSISTDEETLKERIVRIQKEAYELFPYPCILHFHFVSLKMMKNLIYKRALEAGRNSDSIFLDIGCCMGTDVRKLVQDGYPAHHVFGCDIRPEFIRAGYDLYQDENDCRIRFFSSDVFDVPVNAASVEVDVPLPSVSNLSDLTNRVTHLYAGALFHLFDEATQYAIAVRMATLIRRGTGAIIFGRHQGLDPAGMIDDVMDRVRYGHSPESWKRMWHRVFVEMEGAKFAEERLRVDAEFAESFQIGKMQVRMMYWSVSIL